MPPANEEQLLEDDTQYVATGPAARGQQYARRALALTAVVAATAAVGLVLRSAMPVVAPPMSVSQSTHGTLRTVTRTMSQPSLCDTVKQHSGYFDLTTGDKHYFYWFFESRRAPSTDPLILWMTGGPGCSSAVALFGENGPCQVDADGKDTTINRFSWNTQANVLYIDQPAGTGFSYGGGLDHNEQGVADDMYDFLQQFMKAHPEYAKLPFFAFGESYAGHYIPAVTHKVWEMNKALPAGDVRINLVGMSVGNGLTNPSVQYKYYPEMAISANKHKPAVSNLTHGLMELASVPCTAAIKACQKESAACIVATEVCNAGLLMPYTRTGMNVYDMREQCKVPPLCYDFSNVGTFLNLPRVRSALGVDPKHKWSDCNMEVNLQFQLAGDGMRDYQQMIPEQLAAGIKVLIYAGDQDYICNWLGNQAWVRALEWPHQRAFNSSAVVGWLVGGKEAGTVQTSHNLTFLRVYEAGHMVPRDQPEVSLAMVQAFLENRLG